MEPATIRDILNFVLGDSYGKKEDFLRWPPDVFAVAGHILQLSGAYVEVVKTWPPSGFARRDWQEYADSLGKKWRLAAMDNSVPTKIKIWWRCVLKYQNMPLTSIKKEVELWQTLVCLCTVADAACAGVGVPDPRQPKDAFATHSAILLRTRLTASEPSTLCQAIHPSKLVVLPKIHTPQRGITLRSLTHHLSLSVGYDVVVQWCEALAIEGWKAVPKFKHGITVLIVPYPFRIDPSQFEPALSANGPLRNMHSDFGFFDFIPKQMPTTFVRDLRRLCKKAKDKVGRLDGVIFPEMALQPDEYAKVRKALLPEVEFFISGVYERAGRQPAQNYAKITAKFSEGLFVELQQKKHHRWYLENNQICQYGLGSTLDPNKKWWEFTQLGERKLTFLSLDAWLTISVLICEDLARPDPVGNILRAVGPNLVIALLQDGPQLASRWSARCATVLADDPGCSVLTVTSAGMAAISRPPQEVARGSTFRQVVALWKDKETGTCEIVLPDDAQGIVLCMTNTYEKEWTADGRHDSESAGTLRLSGVHPI